ncbi:gliding motility-associated C-terminal domain-containing protein [Fluviicola chungangensis]|uniref:Gliding motility-associated C-terminal domain-containing protein n=1 Tax=Fluviicola chungangensis TaxID=2597671 RepID=A0A556MGK5_9FLAO|nr:gliding motility-associated C-terminal domain-containing protein [Fluviicola chungangensis]TSJ38989.1 gliding motility-associated C-terminal domain-containing protein [Fluviicola chungangensis]
MRSILLSILLLLICNFGFSQKAKDGDYTVVAAGTVLNAYTNVTANVAVNATSISVASNTLTNSFFSTNLAAGDLILIIQMQGADMDIVTTPAVPTASGGWGGNYTLSSSAMGDLGNMGNYRQDWGTVTNYNNSGKYEYAEVLSVAAGTINVRCALKNAYTTSGHVQVVRVPRIGNLTLNASTNIVPAAWNGSTGGIVALEVNGTLNFGTNSKIIASGYGFRGGVTDNTSGGPGAAGDIGKPGYSAASEGSEKGEGIGGAAASEYTTLYSRYGCGAPANGGGGGNYKNSGGGGGSNIGTGMYNGKGVATAGYNAFWNLETAGMATTPSSGGGRGGYSGSQNNQDESVVGPNNAAWSGDSRRKEGGLGGHPLTYDATRVFMGGGGGAGEMDQNQGGSGGAGGGIVFIQSYGSITGSGTIEANGANGQNSNPTNAPNPGSFSSAKLGVDGAGGAGGGGAIIISNGTALPATLTLSAIGGNGGNNALSFGSFASGVEADGPGGGGGGGMIAYTSGTPVQSVAGGANGTVTVVGTTNIVANFPPNGATGGANGQSSLPQTYYNLIANNASICSGNTANVSVTVQGTLPAPITNANITWYTTYTGNTSVGTGLTFTTPVLTATTTYYVGFCPNGTFRVPVTVTVGGPTISGTATVTNATCSSGGSITGLTTSGGAPTPVITWNGVTAPTMNLTNAAAGSYTVTVTDGIGCTATSGPYVIGSSGGPTINSTNMVVTNASCLGGGGSITGITATGTGLTYNWNTGAYSTLDITGLNTGNYNLVVTDNNGCTASLGPINVGQNTGPVINTTNMVVTGTTCGTNNGSITGISATGTGLTYNWNTGAFSTLDITGLTSGNYNLVVTDNNGCTASVGPIAIGASTAPVINSGALVITDAHCGQSNGAIAGLSVSGGQPAYTYNWNSGAYSTLNLNAIPAGNYNLTVTDNLGCTASAGPFTVNDIAGPVINTSNIVITDETCAGNDGSITGITASGTGTLTYNWNLVPSASLDHTNLAGGTYALAVSDAFGCNAVAGPFNVGLSPGPAINTTNMVVTGTTCGANNGSITGITATGTGLTYQWNGVSSATLDQTNLASGNYTLVVTDAGNCTSTFGPVSIGASSSPVINSASIAITDAHCGQSTGAISGLSVSGGQPAYTYNWNAGAYNTLNLSNIPAGTYNLQVTDNLGCTANAGPFTVNAIAGPTLNATNVQVTAETCALNDGTISGLTTTGTGLTYTWNGVASPTLNQTNLAPGTYNVVVSDGFGCSVNGGPFTVNAVVPLSLNQGSLVITPTGCVGNTGAINGLQIAGGINPTVSWTNTSATTLDISNLGAGSYTITVSDDQNCSVQQTFNVGTTSGLTINTNNAVISNDNCAVGSGSIFGITISGGTVPYSYSWNSSPVQNTLNASSLATGNYTLTVTDNSGCQASTTLFVGVVPPSTIDQANVVVTNESCVGNNGTISGIQVSGNAPFTYSWTGTPLTSLNLTNLTAGVYTLTLTDGNGCVTNGTPITVGSDGMPVADFTISNPVASPGEAIDFTNTSTGGPFQNYSWTVSGVGLIGTGSSATFSSQVETTYQMTLIVETVDGCIDSITKPFEILGEIKIPNIVTANGDHTNDEFYITNLKPNSKLIIENRWGNVVFESDNYKNDWGGIDISGEKLVDGVYFYQLITADGKMWQGNVHLLID